MEQIPLAMDKQLDVLHCHTDGGLLLGASGLTGRYWLGSLWYYQTPETAPDHESCTAGVQLEAGISDAKWVDTTRVLVALDTGGVALWNLTDDYHTFELLHAAAGHDDVATSVSVVCDKTKGVSCGQDRKIQVWDLSTVSLTYSTRGHADLISCLDCHPSDPDVFVSCAQDDRILLWDKRKSKPASILNKSPVKRTATCVRWQPGEQHKLAVGSEAGEVAVLDTRMGVENSLLANPHSRSVYSLQFCPNKPKLLASVSEDSRTSVLCIGDSALTQRYLDETHTDFVHGVTWSSESELYTCGWDSKVVRHNVETKQALIMGSGVTQTIQVNGIYDKPVPAKQMYSHILASSKPLTAE